MIFSKVGQTALINLFPFLDSSLEQVRFDSLPHIPIDGHPKTLQSLVLSELLRRDLATTPIIGPILLVLVMLFEGFGCRGRDGGARVVGLRVDWRPREAI